MQQLDHRRKHNYYHRPAAAAAAAAVMEQRNNSPEEPPPHSPLRPRTILRSNSPRSVGALRSRRAGRRTFGYKAKPWRCSGRQLLGSIAAFFAVAYSLFLLWMQTSLDDAQLQQAADTYPNMDDDISQNAVNIFGNSNMDEFFKDGENEANPVLGGEKLRKQIMQEKLNEQQLPPDSKLESCQWLDTRTSSENERILKRCDDSTSAKVYYNGFGFDRYITCAKDEDQSNNKNKTIIKLHPYSATLMSPSQGCQPDSTVPRLFPVIPTITNAEQLPPIKLRFGHSEAGGQLFPGCNVPCRDFGSFDVNALRSVDVDYSHERWDFLFSMEGPHYYSMLEHNPDAWRRNRFYATTSMRTSEVPLPYFSRAEHDIEAAAPVDHGAAIPAAVFLARNCASMNNRESIVEQLLDLSEKKVGIRVDSLSMCLRNRDPPPGVNLNGEKTDVLRHYLFYLAFENQNVEDYITEKLWQPMAAGVVPVYHGAPNVKDHVPDNSIVLVEDFPDIKSLAIHLKKVASDKELYESYHAWRKQPLPEHFRARYDMTDTHSTCRMCRWAYARMYGLGWDHGKQELRELLAGPREVCLNPQGLVRQPFAEVWTDAVGVEMEVHKEGSSDELDTSCQLGSKNQKVVLGEVIERTVQYRDGVTDLVVQSVPRSAKREAENSVLHLRAPLTETSPSLRLVRDGVWHLQDNRSRYTLLISPSSAVSDVTTQGGGSMILQIVSLPLQLRVIVEDVDTFHKGADQVENYFGKLMADSFFQPLETFVVVGKND